MQSPSHMNILLKLNRSQFYFSCFRVQTLEEQVLIPPLHAISQPCMVLLFQNNYNSQLGSAQSLSELGHYLRPLAQKQKTLIKQAPLPLPPQKKEKKRGSQGPKLKELWGKENEKSVQHTTHRTIILLPFFFFFKKEQQAVAAPHTTQVVHLNPLTFKKKKLCR